MTEAQTQAVQTLQAAGYQCEADANPVAVIVQDPVSCQSGARTWVEQKARTVYLWEVASFLNTRS